MKPDLYTKAMLTIIAACLVWLSVGGPSRLPVVQAQAAGEPQRVYLAGWVKPLPNPGTGSTIQRFTDSTGLPVTVTNSR